MEHSSVVEEQISYLGTEQDWKAGGPLIITTAEACLPLLHLIWGASSKIT